MNNADPELFIIENSEEDNNGTDYDSGLFPLFLYRLIN